MEEIVGFDVNGNAAKVFAQYGYIKNYCTTEKFEEWKEKKLPSEERWVEVFKHMEASQVPYLEFSRLVEFVLCLPGTSAPVERVFSSAKNVWKTESSQLEVNTLKSILLVKTNLEYKCVDFYHFLKSQPQLLRKISGQEKYPFKDPQSTDAAVGGAASSNKMSIDSTQSEH